MGVVVHENDAVDEPVYLDAPAEGPSVDNPADPQTEDSKEPLELENQGEEAIDEEGQEPEVEAEASGQEQGDSGVDERQRELDLLRDQVGYLMAERQQAPDIESVQKTLNGPFRFTLPEDLSSAKGISDELRQIAKDDPASVTAMGEMINLLLDQYQAHSKRVGEAQQTMSQHYEAQRAVLNTQLRQAGIDPGFVDSNEFAEMLKDEKFKTRAQGYYTLYGEGSPKLYTNLHADLREWANANNVQLAKQARQQVADKGKGVPRVPRGKSAPSKSGGGDDFWSKVDSAIK